MSMIKSFIAFMMMVLLSISYAKINVHDLKSIQYTPEQKETVEFLNRAIEFYQKNGLTKSIHVFSKGNIFKKDHHYIFIINKMGTVVAHGFNLVGKESLSRVKTMSGENFSKVLYNLGNNPDGGWYTIVWTSPKNDSRLLKSIYVKKLPCSQVDCKDMVIGTGYY